jgi:hypothetical protein
MVNPINNLGINHCGASTTSNQSIQETKQCILEIAREILCKEKLSLGENQSWHNIDATYGKGCVEAILSHVQDISISYLDRGLYEIQGEKFVTWALTKSENRTDVMRNEAVITAAESLKRLEFMGKELKNVPLKTLEEAIGNAKWKCVPKLAEAALEKLKNYEKISGDTVGKILEAAYRENCDDLLVNLERKADHLREPTLRQYTNIDLSYQLLSDCMCQNHKKLTKLLLNGVSRDQRKELAKEAVQKNPDNVDLVKILIPEGFSSSAKLREFASTAKDGEATKYLQEQAAHPLKKIISACYRRVFPQKIEVSTEILENP